MTLPCHSRRASAVASWLSASLAVLLAAGCASGERSADERSVPMLTSRSTQLLVAPPVPPGAASAAALPAATAAAEPAPHYAFSAGDEFDLRVPDAPQFDQTLKVRPDGKVSLALIGTVHALGRTPEDVQAELRERLAQLAGARGSREYLLQPGDEFDVKFPYQPQLNEAVRVRPDGKVQLQMVGTVQAEGASPEELQALLRDRYARFLRTPDLAVIVRSFATQNVRTGGVGSGAGVGRAGLADLRPTVIVRNFQPPQVFVGGEVTRPGVLAYRPGLSLLQALIEAGGNLPSGDAARLLVLRRVAAGSTAAAGAGTSTVTAAGGDSVEVIRVGFDSKGLRRPDRDLLLQPFDLVLLPKSDTANLADTLNQYVFNLVPFLKNSSFGFAYNIGARY